MVRRWRVAGLGPHQRLTRVARGYPRLLVDPSLTGGAFFVTAITKCLIWVPSVNRFTVTTRAVTLSVGRTSVG
jgi:hypothetical protein